MVGNDSGASDNKLPGVQESEVELISDSDTYFYYLKKPMDDD